MYKMALSVSTPVHFIIDNFNTEITLDVCGNLTAAPVAMDVSAVADLYVDASLVRLAFQIQTDASDVVNVDSTDIKYFVDREIFWSSDVDHSFAINSADAILNHVDTPVKIMDSTAVPEKNMVCHDFVRYLALKLFNTPYAVDLFANELELLNDIRLKSQKVWATIDKELAKFATLDYPLASTTIMHDVNYVAQEPHAGTYGPSNWKYYINTDTQNISKKLLEQMAYYNPDRLKTIKNTTDIQPIPFIGGDTISLKLTINPASGLEDLTHVSPFGARTFRIRFNLVENYTLLHSQEVARAVGTDAENDLYRTFLNPILA
jgi:hypothetical protein